MKMIPLKKGSIGAAVEELQKLLKIVVDGDFGPITEKAVIEFQKLCGLKVDGIVGENTLSKLTKPAVKKETASEYLWILDNGHGGIIDGVYQTSGKRSPQWEDGTQLFEGEFNRAVVKRIIKLCEGAGIECINLVDTEEDLSLRWRTDKANDIYRERKQTDGKKCIYVSVHANGFNKESAHGWSVYTTVGETKSDKIAQVLHEKAKAEFPTHKMRMDNRDGDADKEANFWVLRKVVMPSILSENFFMTNREESRLLLSDEGRDRIAKIHFQMIQEIEETKIV
jgi:N-acetylmuramoyl-L-alanine amidase